MSYYFAYGSNLDVNRMTSRCPSAEVVGIGKLKGYRLTFMENNAKSVVANVIKKKGSTVAGVVYFISKGEEWRYLDTCEGHPFVYNRTDLDIELVDGDTVNCSVYIMDKERVRPVYFKDKKGAVVERYSSTKREEGVPKKEYLRYLVNGYKQHQLDIENLKSILYKNLDDMIGVK